MSKGKQIESLAEWNVKSDCRLALKPELSIESLAEWNVKNSLDCMEGSPSKY